MKLMRWLPGVLIMLGVLVLAGCGASNGNDDRDSARNVGDNDGPDDNDSGNNGTPPIAGISGNLYLPTNAGVIWHYETVGGGEPATSRFDGTTSIGGIAVGKLVYSVGLTDYVLSTAEAIGYAGSAFSFSDGFNGNVYGIDMKLRTAHTLLGQGASGAYSGNGSIGVTPGNLQFSSLPYNGIVTPGVVSMIDAGEWGALPARRVVVMLNPGGVLGDLGIGLPIYLQPLLARRTTELWLTPGVGIVQRKDGAVIRRLTLAEGLQKPLVFDYSNGVPAQPAAQLVLVNGEPLTHQEWPMEVLYRTNPTDWLTVAFDDTGSWQARLSSPTPGAGLHAATIRFKRDSGDLDVPVILFVK